MGKEGPFVGCCYAIPDGILGNGDRKRYGEEI